MKGFLLRLWLAYTLRRRVRRTQWVWWWHPADWALGFSRLRPEDTSMGLIYAWQLAVGPLEVRGWLPRDRQADALVRHRNARGKWS